jgi:hypothetical protein
LYDAATEDVLLSSAGPFGLDVFRVWKIRELNVSQRLQTVKPEYSWLSSSTDCVAMGL